MENSITYGKRVKFKLKKISCLTCDTAGSVLILLGKIISLKWQYFGVLRLDNKTEYWECRNCRK